MLDHVKSLGFFILQFLYNCLGTAAIWYVTVFVLGDSLRPKSYLGDTLGTGLYLIVVTYIAIFLTPFLLSTLQTQLLDRDSEYQTPIISWGIGIFVVGLVLFSPVHVYFYQWWLLPASVALGSGIWSLPAIKLSQVYHAHLLQQSEKSKRKIEH